MKLTLKTLTVIVLFLFTLTISAQPYNYSYDYLKRAEKNSLQTMDSELNSLVESVIFNMIVFKNAYPEWKFDNIVEKLNDLTVDGKTLSIRYKAQLASTFINNYSMFNDVKIEEKNNPAKYFMIIADRMQKSLIASN